MFYPVELFANWFTYNLLGLAQESHLAGSVQFFVYDSIKILILLILINYSMAIIRHFLPTEKIRDFLTKRKLYGLDYLFASLFGCITPFCTCSSIPLFVGFLGARIPLGVTFSFLITSPLVNEAAVAVFLSIWGWKITLMYVGAGLIIGVLGGFILGKLKLEKYVEDFVWKASAKKLEDGIKTNPSKKELFNKFTAESFDITKKILPYVLGGLAIGAAIHGYVPDNFFKKYITKENPFAVPLAVILAVPLYANATGVIPVVQSLVAKGIPLGTALAFMMATVGLSLPEALILKKVMKLKLLLFFFGIVALGMTLIGYLFNLVLD